jgi:signal peptidase I
MAEPQVETTRRVRPWIAALLTFLGWGVGLYYARRTSAALWWVAANVLIGVAIGGGVLVYAVTTGSLPFSLDPNAFNVVDMANLGLSAVVAVFVWVMVAKRQQVARGAPVRLLGYLAIWLLPILVSLVLAMTIRFTLFQPFRIPSGSMQPTLSIGDYVVVSKRSYGYSRLSVAPFEGLFPPGRVFARLPARGDLVVYRPAGEPDRDFVSRIVGMPGDWVQMIGGALHLNGERVPLELLSGADDPVRALQETLPNGVRYTILDHGDGELDNTRVFVVPDGHYFMMGDNRDNANDSRRSVGFVPYDHLIGRVDFISRSPTWEQ